jgi:hypothetical protein
MLRSISRSMIFCLILLPANLLAAVERKTADAVLVADSRNLSGIMAWWANLFNESHFYFALLTIVVVPLAGIVLGTAADVLIGRIGIDLKSRALREG